MTKIIKTIDVLPQSFMMKEKVYLRIQFDFTDCSRDIFNVEETDWLKILAQATGLSSVMSVNDIKKEIYYAVVMGTAEFRTEA